MEQGRQSRLLWLSGPQSQVDQDEALARQLHQQLNVESGYAHRPQDDYAYHHQEPDAVPNQASVTSRTPASIVAQDLAHSLFAFDRREEEGHGRGKGRGGGRGGRSYARR